MSLKLLVISLRIRSIYKAKAIKHIWTLHQEQGTKICFQLCCWLMLNCLTWNPQFIVVLSDIQFDTMLSSKKQYGDERFLRVQKDPRFWEMPEREHKIKIDKRFKSMFSDKRFKVKYTVDKRGRPINHTSTEDLKCFYKVSDSEEEEETEKKKNRVTEKKVKKGSTEQLERGVHMSKGGEKSLMLVLNSFLQ